MRAAGKLLGVLVAVAAHAACDGNAPASSAPTPRAAPARAETPSVCAPARAPLRRLTREQYDHTVRDIFGTTLRPAATWPPDEELTGFASGAPVSPLQAELYLRGAEDVAREARPRLAAMAACADGTDAACARAFIERVGRRAWRRPLERDEVGRLETLYRGARTAGEDHAGALAHVVEALLASPQLIYLVERGAPSGTSRRAPAVTSGAPLTSFEMASRLSYFLLGTGPDETLLDLAASDRLATEADVEREARRMLADARARDALMRFFDEWLGLEKLHTLTKALRELRDATPELMHAELRAFVESVVFDGDGRLATLLTASHTFVNEPLARLYGIPGVRGPELRRVELDPTRRAGVLTSLGVMTLFSTATQSSPVHRGKLVRDRLLCQPIPPPPDGLIIVPPDPDPSSSTREQYEEHLLAESCSRCHARMDPLGFAFEHYDAIGRWRDDDAGRPVDATGSLDGTSDENGNVDGAVELAHRLARSRDVRDCAVTQLFRYVLGRNPGAGDACVVDRIESRFEASNGNLRELVIALVTSDAFRFRATDAEAP